MALTTLTTTLPDLQSDMASVGSMTDAYFAGGDNETAQIGVIDNLNYSSGTCSVIAATLSVAKDSVASFNSSTAGYFAGGNLGITLTNVVENLNFSSLACTLMSITLTNSVYGAVGVQSSTDGYFSGGSPDSATAVSSIDDIDFTTGTRYALGTALAVGVYQAASTSTVMPPLSVFAVKRNGINFAPKLKFKAMWQQHHKKGQNAQGICICETTEQSWRMGADTHNVLITGLPNLKFTWTCTEPNTSGFSKWDWLIYVDGDKTVRPIKLSIASPSAKKGDHISWTINLDVLISGKSKTQISDRYFMLPKQE